MNTANLIEKTAEQFNMPKATTKRIVNFITDAIIAEVRSGEKVKLTGFGTFYRHERKERPGRNPQSGEPVKIPARAVPKFKPGKEFKDMLED